MESIFKLGILLSIIDKVSGPSKNIGEGMTGLRGRILSLGPAFSKFKKWGIIVATVAAGLLTMFSSTVTATIPTQKALGELSSVGIENLSALETASTQFSGNWSGTTKAEFLSAAYDIKSGISTLSDEGVGEFTKLAALTGKATKSTTAEMTSLFATGYGIYKEQYENISDLQFGQLFSAGIAASVKNFKTTGSGMSQAISALGATATKAKIPLEEQLSVLGMLQQTMSGGEAGTKYKALMGSAAAAGQKLNLSFMDANNQLLGMPGILKTLQSKYGNTLDAMEKLEIQKAFGTQEAVAVIDLMYSKVDALETNIHSISGAMDKGTSFTEKMAGAMNKDIGSGIQLLSQRFNNLLEVIGNQLIPILTPLFATIGEIINEIITWSQANQETVQVITIVVASLTAFVFVAGTVVAVLGLVGVATTHVAVGLKSVSLGTGAMKRAFLRSIVASKAFIVSLWAKTAALRAAGGGIISYAITLGTSFLAAIGPAILATWAFTTALLCNPVTWIVLAIVAAVGLLIWALYELYQNFDQVKEAVSNFVNTIKEGINEAWNWVTGIIPRFYNSGKALWGAFTDGVKSNLSAAKIAVKSGLTRLRNLLPFSNAKEGPLSNLTVSGASLMTTFAQGAESKSGALKKVVKTAMAGAGAAMVISGSVTANPGNLNLKQEIPKIAAEKSGEVQKVSKSESKHIDLTIEKLVLPQVKDANDLMKELEKLVETHDE
ncbi:MAG: phage tail tape measure protein [Desulfobacterales bacterium]|nr:phage tail tape measure protein [Desulfobacterales bacterium]